MQLHAHTGGRRQQDDLAEQRVAPHRRAEAGQEPYREVERADGKRPGEVLHVEPHGLQAHLGTGLVVVVNTADDVERLCGLSEGELGALVRRESL